MYLTGSRRMNLDSKVRLTLPADFRKEFPDGKVKLVPVMGALYGFTPQDYVKWIERNCPEADEIGSRDARKARTLNAHTVEVEIDSAGRICVGRMSDADRQKLGLVHDVVTVGNGNHFEIWEAARWDALHASTEAQEDDELLFG